MERKIKMGRNLKIFAELERKEPFTDREKRSLHTENWGKDRPDYATLQFIRDIQATQKLNKKEAIQYYKNYRRKSIEGKRSISDEIDRGIKNLYPEKRRSDRSGEIMKDIYYPKQKVEKPNKITKNEYIRNKQPARKYKSISEYLSRAKVSKETKIRVKNAHEKYPNATLYELQHGVNSKASKDFRRRNGL